MRVALLTDAARAHGTPDDQVLPGALAAEGIAAEFVPWDRVAPESLAAFDRVVIRTPWDYHRRLDAFEAFLDAVPVPVDNPVPLVRWNARKAYLATLGEHGIPTILHDGGPLDFPWDEAVVKPEVSAGGFETFRVRRGEPAAVREGVRYLVQPFLPEVLAEGETSFIFLGGEPSHAVQKRPASGNFLVQEEHGGSTRRVRPSAADWERAAARLPASDLLYARVDLIAGYVVELELIEPELYFRFDEASPARFARAVRRGRAPP